MIIEKGNTEFFYYNTIYHHRDVDRRWSRASLDVSLRASDGHNCYLAVSSLREARVA